MAGEQSKSYRTVAGEQSISYRMVVGEQSRSYCIVACELKLSHGEKKLWAFARWEEDNGCRTVEESIARWAQIVQLWHYCRWVALAVIAVDMGGDLISILILGLGFVLGEINKL